jgi:endonuclease YncB( thermonuclease family)
MKAFKITALLWFVFLTFALTVSAQQPQTITSEDVKKEVERLGAEIYAPQPMRTITGKVVGVHDGDTITVLDSEKRQHKIRFEGIDAPELKQEFGNKSKENLSGLVFGRQVSVQTNKTDKYDRTVGKVLLEGKDINYVQVLFGFAWHYKKYENEQSAEDRKTYAEAEVKARANKVGIWALPKQTPPWDWRRGTDNENLAGVPQGSIIGNTNSMIYHTPGCSTYAKVSSKNRAVFKTEEEAIKAGYRLSGACESTLPIESRPKKTATAAGSNNSSSDRIYIRGSRGGCYYINSSGKKTYVDRSLCN